jgi:hypothetical protein
MDLNRLEHSKLAIVFVQPYFLFVSQTNASKASARKTNLFDLDLYN